MSARHRVFLCPKCKVIRTSMDKKCGICKFPVGVYLWLKDCLARVEKMNKEIEKEKRYGWYNRS